MIMAGHLDDFPTTRHWITLLVESPSSHITSADKYKKEMGGRSSMPWIQTTGSVLFMEHTTSVTVWRKLISATPPRALRRFFSPIPTGFCLWWINLVPFAAAPKNRQDLWAKDATLKAQTEVHQASLCLEYVWWQCTISIILVCSLVKTRLCSELCFYEMISYSTANRRSTSPSTLWRANV